MPEVLIQYLLQQRGERPTGFRIWPDGRVEHCAATNPVPTPTARLDHEPELIWQESGRLDTAQLGAVKEAIRQAKLEALPPRLLINYCKEDPGAALWTFNLDGQSGQITVYDPHPKRHPQLDTLLAQLQTMVA
jgi:hypothetical protein